MGQETINTAVLIVAGGTGSRMGTDVPKQYQRLAGKMVLRHTLEAVRRALPDCGIQVVIRSGDEGLYASATKGLDLLPPVYGGSDRQKSVFNGLQLLSKLKPELVLIHDAARPFAPEALFHSVIAELKTGTEAAIPALELVDTLKQVATDGTIETTLDRSRIKAVQTPQGFRFETIWRLHQTYQHKSFTDDAGLLESEGIPCKTIAGAEENFKITQAQDMLKATGYLLGRTPDIRIGTGFDVHRFEPGDGLILCGVKIPFHSKLKGHSDADVGLHALTDALFAALSAQDIGHHFPPSDNAFRNSNSAVFLQKAAQMVAERGGMIAHLTVTLICEAPKIGPYREEMCTCIAKICNLDQRRVSVQATTSEKLGFTGRGEGIAAQASATVRLPLGADEP